MTPAHVTNVGIHVTAGTIALAIGFTMLAKAKGTFWHRRMGRIFCYVTLVVCLSAIVGTVYFRFVPIFAVLSVLVPYQLVSGWRSIYTRDRGPSKIDAAWTMAALALAVVLFPAVLEHPTKAPVVVHSSLAALAGILAYDAIRWVFPKRWYRTLWRYEHAYKLIASVFAMLSAFVGNVVRIGQPWSQIAPSVVGLFVILYFFWQLFQLHETAKANVIAYEQPTNKA